MNEAVSIIKEGAASAEEGQLRQELESLVVRFPKIFFHRDREGEPSYPMNVRNMEHVDKFKERITRKITRRQERIDTELEQGDDATTLVQLQALRPIFDTYAGADEKSKRQKMLLRKIFGEVLTKVYEETGSVRAAE